MSTAYDEHAVSILTALEGEGILMAVPKKRSADLPGELVCVRVPQASILLPFQDYVCHSVNHSVYVILPSSAYTDATYIDHG